MIETKTTYAQRTIKEEEQHLCSCEEPAVQGCTDSILVNGVRQESQLRFGCERHPVVPMYYYADGHSVTWEEFKRGLA